MDNYTIYCTEEQVRQAIELGAPIKLFCKDYMHGHLNYMGSPIGIGHVWINNDLYYAPTAEQMIMWLEEQDVVIDILAHYIGCDEHEKNIYVYDWWRNDVYNDDITYETRKEATIAAINNALEYLSNEK